MGWSHGRLVAEAYDAKAPIGHSYGDVEYYSRHLAGASGLVLEVGSGTGRILIRLLEAGLDVEGLEQSPAMIEVCRSHCAERGLSLTLYEGDMASFVREHAYAAVIVPAGAINSLDGREGVTRALDCFARSLVGGGQLIVDLEIPGRLSGPRPTRLWHRGEHVWTAEAVHYEYDASTDQVREFVRYDKWTEGLLAASEMHVFRTQNWRPGQFAELVESAGFDVVRMTANYDDEATPGDNDKDWTVHAVRAG